MRKEGMSRHRFEVGFGPKVEHRRYPAVQRRRPAAKRSAPIKAIIGLLAFVAELPYRACRWLEDRKNSIFMER